MIKKKLLVASCCCVFSAAVAVGCSAEPKRQEKIQKMETQQTDVSETESTVSAKAKTESSTASKREEDDNSSSKIGELDLQKIERITKQVDSSNWKDMKRLARIVRSYADAPRTNSKDSVKAILMFPEMPCLPDCLLLQNDQSPIELTRKDTAAYYLNDSSSVNSVISAPTAKETTFNINGYDITLGKTTLRDLVPLFQKNGAYAAALRDLNIRERMHWETDEERETGWYAHRQTMVLNFFANDHRSGVDNLLLEVLPMSGVITGVRVWVGRTEEEKLLEYPQWQLNGTEFSNAYIDDIKAAHQDTPYKEIDYAPNGDYDYLHYAGEPQINDGMRYGIWYGNGADEDRVIYDAKKDGKVRAVAYLLATNRFQIIEE